jgi:hypothetical protein
MRTVIDLPQDLLDAARQLARARGGTLAAVLEAGLREAVIRRKAGQFTLRHASVPGDGLTAEFAGATAARIRAAAYDAG